MSANSSKEIKYEEMNFSEDFRIKRPNNSINF